MKKKFDEGSGFRWGEVVFCEKWIKLEGFFEMSSDTTCHIRRNVLATNTYLR